MRTQNIHLRVLVFLLTTIGILLTAYQIIVLSIPVTENETDMLWNVDAKVQFDVTNRAPVKLEMFVPPLDNGYMALNESYISKNYGISINEEGNNRVLTWSARRPNNEQTLFYRLLLTGRYGADSAAEDINVKGPTYREAIKLEGPEKVAIESLIAPIRNYSADIETFISEAIKRINNENDDNVKLLLQNDYSIENKVKILEILLSNAHVPIESVHVLRLSQPNPQSTELWVRSFNGKKWLYFNPETGHRGLPKDRLIWWFGDSPLMKIEGGSKPKVSFSISNNEVNAIRLGQLVQDANSASSFLDYSLYGLPLIDQQTYKIIVMIPIGVLFILILRNLIGLQTLGTFTPVLIAMAFRETGLGFGVVFFTVITAFGLMLRSYLEYLKLQMLPRLSVVLTFVVLLMAVISLLSHRLGFASGLSVSLFPMVILTMTIERLSITWDERGGNTAFKQGVTTLIAAAGGFYIMNIPELRYFIFTFPGVLLVLAAFMLAMGRYRGYRLTELFRFSALLKD